MSVEIERINKMLNDAKSILRMRQERLFEAHVNFDFNQTDENKRMVVYCQGQVDEKANYVKILEAMLRPQEKNITPKVSVLTD